MKICVIFGGISTEHDVSVTSGISVIKNLNKDKYEIQPIYIDQKGEWYKYTKDVKEISDLTFGEKPKELEKIEINYNQENKVIKNINAKAYEKSDNIREILAKHVMSPVYFSKSIEEMLNERSRHIYRNRPTEKHYQAL